MTREIDRPVCEAHCVNIETHPRKVDVRLFGNGNSKLPWREAGPLNHLDDIVDSDQCVVNKELSLSKHTSTGRHLFSGVPYVRTEQGVKATAELRR